MIIVMLCLVLISLLLSIYFIFSEEFNASVIASIIGIVLLVMIGLLK